MPGPTQIAPQQLARLIGTPDSPAILDVCLEDDFARDPRLIPGSRRFDHQDIDAIASWVRGRKAVVVCQKGLKLSAGVAALLRSRGVMAENLEGGQMGWVAAQLPTVRAAAIPGPLWVTRQRPKIDRVACPWLIRRFVDTDAQFLFVAPTDVAGVADRFGAIAFDVEGADWSHRADDCTFDTMLDRFALTMPALQTMAGVIRAADTNQHDLAPQAAGLLAISVGLSRQFRDDDQMLAAAMPIYDALFRWARDAQDEGHSWP